MFARFRKTKTSLQVSLITTRRVPGKVLQEHVAALGSVADPASAYDRIKFWQALHLRLAGLRNRVDANTAGQVMTAIHSRIPMVTPDEQRELRLATAEEEARLAQSLLDMHVESVTGHKALIQRAQASVSQGEAAAADLAKDAGEAGERAKRLRSGEDAPGKISRPMTQGEFMKAIGWTKADLRHARVLQELHKLGLTETATRAVVDSRQERAVYRKVLRKHAGH
jgi:hypothetical protein